MKKKIVLSGLVLTVILLVSGCATMFDKTVKQSRNVGEFTGINVSGEGAVLHIIQGNKDSVAIKAKSGVLDKITTKVEDGVLQLPYDSSLVLIVPVKPRPVYYVTIRNLNELILSAGTKVKIEGLKAGKLDIDIKGRDPKIYFTDNCKLAELEIKVNDGADPIIKNVNLHTTTIKLNSNLKIQGKTDIQNVIIQNGSNYYAKHFMSKQADVKKQGSGEARLTVEKNLNLDMSGSGELVIYGNPKIDMNSKTGRGEFKVIN
jgi:hypothetical protein